MAVKRAALGRGLSAFFGEAEVAADSTEGLKADISARALVRDVDIDMLDAAPGQPRHSFNEDKLRELADSITEHGVVQPVLCVKRGERFELVAGERRWRAARMAGLKTIPVLLGEFSERERREIALIENLQRQDLNAMEEAEAIARLIREYGLTQEEVARRLSRSRSAVANSVRLNSLPKELRELVERDEISAGHARALLSVRDERLQRVLASEIVEKGLSVRQAEERAGEMNARPAEKRRKPSAQTPAELAPLEDALREGFGTKVSVRGSADKGKITLEYFSREDAERIFEIARALSGRD